MIAVGGNVMLRSRSRSVEPAEMLIGWTVMRGCVAGIAGHMGVHIRRKRCRTLWMCSLARQHPLIGHEWLMLLLMLLLMMLLLLLQVLLRRILLLGKHPVTGMRSVLISWAQIHRLVHVTIELLLRQHRGSRSGRWNGRRKGCVINGHTGHCDTLHGHLLLTSLFDDFLHFGP